MDSIAQTGVKVVMSADPVGIIKGFAQADTAGQKFAATLGGISNVGKATVNAIQGVGQALERTARRTRNAGIGIGVALLGATYSAIGFEASMRNVATIDAAARDSFGKTSAQIIQMSRVLPQSAKELAEGYYDVASSGFYGAEGQTVLFASAKAASAGLTSTAEASRAVTAVLNAYGMSANQAGKVSDLLFQTVNLGVVNFQELTGVIGDSVGLAAQAGVKFKEVGGAIATMTLNGVSASEAGTSLNRLIQNLIQPTEALQEAWGRLSHQTLTQALASMGLEKVMERLRLASGGNVQVLLQWFDEIRAARGALALMSNEGETYARVMRQMDEATQGQGATQRAFDQQMMSTQAQIKLMINELRSIGLEIGTVFLPAVKAGAQAITFMAGAWNVLPGPMKAVLAIASAVASALMTLIGILGVFALKTFVAQRATLLIANGLSLAATRVAGWGDMWTGAATKMGVASDYMRSRATGAFNIFSPITGTIRGVASLLDFLGTKMLGMSATTDRAGFALGNFAARLRGVANWLPRIAALLPIIATGAILMLGDLNRANQEADQFVTQLTSKFNLNSYVGIRQAIEKVDEAQVRAEASISKYKGALGALRGGFGALGRAGLNLFGAGEVAGDPFGDIAKRNALTEKYNELIDKQTNIWNAAADVRARLNPMERDNVKIHNDIAASQGLVAKAAKQMGIDLQTETKLSDKEIRQLARGFQELQNRAGGAAVGVGGFTTLSAKAAQEMTKYITKTVQDVSDALFKDFSLAKAVESQGAEGQKELKTFLYVARKTAGEFVEDLDELARRGLNPQSLLDLATAGPNAAKAAIEALVGDTSGALIQMTNETVAAMTQMRVKLAAEARLIAIAAAKPMISGDIGQAFDIDRVVREMGIHNTPEKIAYILKMDPASVKKIADEFGITMGESLPPAFDRAINSLADIRTQGNIRRLFNTITASAQISDADAARVFVALITQGKTAAEQVIMSLHLIPPEQQLLLDIIGVTEAEQNLDRVGRKADEVGAKKPSPVVTALTGAAESALDGVIFRLGLIHDKTVSVTVNDFATAALSGVRGGLDAVKAITGAEGMIIKRFGRGGEQHTAHIARTLRIFGEPETGGEAYIPLGVSKRGRSLMLLKQVANEFGYNLERYAGGGVTMRSGGWGGTYIGQVNVNMDLSKVEGTLTAARVEDLLRSTFVDTARHIAKVEINRHERTEGIELARKGR